MSQNNTVNTTPGLNRVVEYRPVPALAAKITGRNHAAVSYLVSLEAERRGVTLSLEAVFGPTGALLGFIYRDESRDQTLTLPPGYHAVLPPNADDVQVMDPESFERSFRVL